MADDDTPRNADFVARVVKDAKSPPEARLLTGWLGDAAQEGERRLYTNPELSCYIDIPTDAILHTEPVRDAQPAGCVFVWVQRDAALKPGGSTASRAARFLQGQVQQDFASGASPEAAGYRCITEVPCGEPTGFTGRCTKQPVVGGAWPCVTAIPHCFEPTGFTGKCTHQPWPNPTQYLGCTFYHCPTQDLTHIPHICNLVATGMPGCPVVNPPQEGDPAAKASAEGGKEGGGAEEARAAVPATSIPGCGYTQTWGLCPTHPPKCQVSVDIPCIPPTETPQCFQGGVAPFAAAQGPGALRSALIQCPPAMSVAVPCPTPLYGCPPQTQHRLLCPSQVVVCTVFGPGCPGLHAAEAAPGAARAVATALIQCNPSAVDACPTRLGCQTQPPTAITACTQLGPSCPSLGIACTLMGPECPTYCGPDCQTRQEGCTKVNCTHAGPLCPTGHFECTQSGPQCPSGGPVCPTVHSGCTVTTVKLHCQIAAQPQAFRAAPIGPTIQAGAQCPTQPSGDCTFFGCQPTPATVCTQIREQCITQPSGDCTFFGCPPTPATVCTQTFQCGPSAVDACPTRLCGVGQQFFRAAGRPTVVCQFQNWHTSVDRICL
ncbi:MAG TPA: hypothetical protein VGP73_27525 [Thermoanaerobaculia bacterium]